VPERNSEFFDDEVDKLDKWAEDMKKALELDLKKLDIDIKTSKTNAKKIVDLEEKIKIQREIKDAEKKRNEMRKRLFEAQDEVEDKKELLIARVEAQMRKRSIIPVHNGVFSRSAAMLLARLRWGNPDKHI